MRLLHRTTREVTLTPAGAVFLDACRALVGAATAADAAARKAADGQAGELRIGAVASAFSDPLPRALETFQRMYSRVDVRVEEVDTHVAVLAVRRRELDVALVRQLAPPPDCERVTLRREQFVLAVPGSWATGTGEPTAPASAAGLPWIWLPRSIAPDYHDQVVACCRAADFAPDAHHIARSIASQLAMVACGLGVALVPESAAHGPGDAEDEGICFLPLERSATIDLAAVWRRGSSPSSTASSEVLGPRSTTENNVATTARQARGGRSW